MSHKANDQKKSDFFDIFCPDCGSTLKVDPVTRTVIAHTPATRAMREQDARKESLFRQAVDAEKNKDDVLSKKFAEALKKAKESPDTGKPLREYDLD